VVMEEGTSISSSDLRAEILELVKSNPDGISNDTLSTLVSSYDPHLRKQIVNELLGENKIEMFQIPGSPGFMIRHKKTDSLINASKEEQLVYSLIEETEKMGIWIRDIRERSGLNDLQLKRILKSLEGKKLVKSVKAVGTTKKSYVLFGIDADESLTGGTFYSDQQLDSEFVQTLIHICVSMLQKRRHVATSESKNDPITQKNSMFVRSDEIAKYIHEKGICKINLGVSDIEEILDIAVLEKKIEKGVDHTYRATKPKIIKTPLTTIPCLFCPVKEECTPGNVISPENCEHIKIFYEI